jgi:serine acetyltransferase
MLDSTLSVVDLVTLTKKEFHRTSTISNVVDRSVVFAKSPEWLGILREKLAGTPIQVMTFCSAAFWGDKELPVAFKKQARPIFLENMIEKFILFHNAVNRNRQPAVNEFAINCKIHPSVVIGAEGMRFIRWGGKTVSMKHMGNVRLESEVEIEAYSVIHRATMDSTVIGRRTKIGNNVSIGHNVVIGENCMITPLTVIGGSCKIGDNVWVGMQTAIADNLQICGHVKIGMGARVVKDITEPGLYYGCPAERKGDWDGSL